MKGFYINLDSRVDRKTHFENNIRTIPFFSNITRLPAVVTKDGPIGCGLSHIKVLQSWYATNEEFFAVFEDDFMILDEDHLRQFVEDFKKIERSDTWDIIVLTPRGNTVVENNDMTNARFRRIIENQTATGYIIKRRMVPILIENLKEAVSMQLQGADKNLCAIDQYWKRLQRKYNFYYYLNVFAGQLPGWSDLENRMVDYNDRFKKQYLY
jgi:GR25 family glycosyltransferase involved in LPS biosynthesis